MTSAYLDHAASTPMRPEAVAAMTAVLGESYANPAASHRAGRQARRLLDDARDQVAAAVGAEPGEVVFTSGGTEADNLAIDGVVGALGGVALCLATDHHAVLDPVRAAGGRTVPVDASGLVDLVALADELAELRSGLPGVGAPVVSLALVNNEVGTTQPLAEVAAVVRAVAPGAVLHADAVAAAAWVDLVPEVAAADLVSVSGHKVGGPKGIGALVVRTGCPLAPVMRGGGQERDRRSGTPNLAGAVGLAAALTATVADRATRVARVGGLRDRLVAGLRATAPGLMFTDAGPRQIANIVHACLPGADSEALLFLLDRAGVAASAASSCASGAMEPSHVLAAMAVPTVLARGALRLSLGWCSTDAEVEHALVVIPAVVGRLQERVAS
ncbi:MAG: cysteine desulfurase family protein [Acidimicrobiales bacterium]